MYIYIYVYVIFVKSVVICDLWTVRSLIATKGLIKLQGEHIHKKKYIYIYIYIYLYI